ncbi:MliC family protein [Pseudohalioglobus lutimaris]|nr:MliC family protein [Pseudohalioglobus lutimaris]
MRNRIPGIIALTLCACAGAASAGITISFPLKTGSTDKVNSASYLCEEGEPLSVQYVNSGVNSLAFLTIEGEERAFVNVISGSGARYVSGQYVWWVKGSNATLANDMVEDSMKNCRLQE